MEVGYLEDRARFESWLREKLNAEQALVAIAALALLLEQAHINGQQYVLKEMKSSVDKAEIAAQKLLESL